MGDEMAESQTKCIVRMFSEEKKSRKQIAEELGIKASSVSKSLCRAGMRSLTRKKLNEDEKHAVINDYKAGLTWDELCDRHEISEAYVASIMKASNDGLTRGTGNCHDKTNIGRKWVWDYDFFGRSTGLSAYWAGFLIADGNVIRQPGCNTRIRLELGAKDEEHLKDFCDDVGLDRAAIGYRDARYRRSIVGGKAGWSTAMPWVSLQHEMLNTTLSQWGLVPNKTYYPIVPTIRESVVPDFLRGWFDGDGDRGRCHNKEYFKITGNTKMLEWYADSLRRVGYNGTFKIHSECQECVWSRLFIRGRKQVDSISRLLWRDSDDSRAMRRKCP